MPPANRTLLPMVEAAAKAFSDATGIPARAHRAQAAGYDATLEFRIGANRFRRPVIVRQTVDRYSVLATVKAIAAPDTDERLTLVTSYLSPNLISACRELQVDALDQAGNASLIQDGSVILVSGRPRSPETPATKGRTWTKATLRVVLAVLTAPSLLEKGYREIAQFAGVSHGTVQNAIHSLLERRDIIERRDGMRLADTDRLIDEWVTLYPALLRGSLLLGRYRADTHDWWQHVPDLPGRCLFGAEPAAALLTGYLKPATVTAYCANDVPKEWIARARLRPDPSGNVEFLKSPILLAPTDSLPPNVVPPLLVYADLVASGDSRNLETARMLREKYLTS